jgi:hypothetical protein
MSDSTPVANEQPKPRKKMGRPSKKTPELVEEICARLAKGEPMSRIAKDDHMPELTNVYKWLRVDDEFRQLYETARADGAHTYAAEIAEIIDEEPLAVYDDAGNKKYDSGSIAHKRLRMDGRKWLAAKYLPKVYGERQILAGDAENPLEVKANTEVFDTLLQTLELQRQAKGKK